MIYLTRIDPDRNLARFYIVAVQGDLFAEHVVMREWGRIGQPGTVRHDRYPDPSAAQEAADQLTATKRKRGYA